MIFQKVEQSPQFFEMCLGGDMGVKLHLEGVKAHLRGEEQLFNETAGTFIVEVESEEVARKLFKKMPFIVLGRTQRERSIEVSNKKDQLFNVNINQLEKAWKKPMEEIFS